MTHISRYALILSAIVVMAVFIPRFYGMAFDQNVGKTHLFYSPVSEKFIWCDKLADPAVGSAENAHHASFVYMDEDGTKYSRRQFEEMLPFIYYRNMELWGHLPLHLGGKTFDKATIKATRQVMELKAREIRGRYPGDQLLPLLETNPGMARLVFPEDRFRLTDEMEFVNADFNKRDEALTETFTRSLRAAGFHFPGRFAAGKPSILKPFDEGVFLVDADDAVFHVKRVDGESWVQKTPIAPKGGVWSIKVSENSRREFYGLLLTGDGQLNLLSCDDYALRPLPLEDYNPDTMDFKLIINPMFRTAVYSDDKVIRAVVMDSEFRPLAKYRHYMPAARLSGARKAFAYLTPFTLNLEDPTTGYRVLSLDWHGRNGLASLGLAMGCYIWLVFLRPRKGILMLVDGVLVALTGLYGLVAVAVLPHEG